MEGAGHVVEELALLGGEDEVGAGTVEELAGVAAEGDDGDVIGLGGLGEFQRPGDELARARGGIESGELVGEGSLEGGILFGNMLQRGFLVAFVHVEAGVLEAIQEGHGVGAVHVAGTGAAGDEVEGGAAEYGDVLDVLQGQDALVLEEDHAFQRALAGDGGVGLEVGLVGVGISLGLRAAGDEFQAAADAHIQFVLGEGTVLDGVHDLLVLQVGARLEHVVAGGNLLGAVVAAEPVGHHEALEAPFVAENRGLQVLALGGVGAVDLVVGAHHGPGVGFLDGDLEALQVDFALGARGDDGVVPGAVRLLVVVGEMLDGGAHVVLLDAAYIRRRRLAGHDRVLGVVLEVAAVQRVAVDVQGRGEIDVGAVLVDLFTHGLAHVLHQLLVPGRGQQGADGEVRAVIGVLVAFAGRVDAEAGGTVGEDDGRDAQPFDGIGGAGGARDDVLRRAHDGGFTTEAGHTGADDEMDLLLEGHGLEDLVDGVFPELGIAGLAPGKGQDSGGNEHDSFHIAVGYCVSLFLRFPWVKARYSAGVMPVSRRKAVKK